jgi:heavy metal translocating P-type ATPase
VLKLRSWDLWLLALCTLALGGGFVAWALAGGAVRDALWIAAIVPALVAAVATIVAALRRGELGVDVVAVLALAGALALEQYLAGAVIALMFASGRSLETYAEARARRELGVLLARTPRFAHRYQDGALADVAVDAVVAGDRLLVKSGEVLPVDGVVAGEGAVIDESALTGEALPVNRGRGEQVRSGTVNAGAPFDLRAIAAARESTYAGVVRLVESAQRQKAPFVRLADRYALLFVPLALGVAGLAWVLSGEALRALAVLVVATPCPLILAAPVALVAGMSRAARRGVLIKGGGAFETLARARVLLFDKTGTLTIGEARLAAMESAGELEPREILRLAASLEQVSQHVMAAAVVSAARERDLALSLPERVSETHGAGLCGEVDGRRVALGSYEYVAARVEALPIEWARGMLRRMAYEGTSGVFVAVDGRLAGVLLLTDRIRADTPKTLRSLRRAGIERVVMVSGDRQDMAETVAAALDVDSVLAERTPEDKVDAVVAERPEGITLMVGDGINDAPALAAADVGIAMGARGAAASSEAADVVLLVDRLDRVTEALLIARRSRRIAVQSVVVGMGLSAAAMAAAAWGFLAPVAGAVLQEGIDVAVILNALRALGRGSAEGPARALPRATAERLKAEHRQLEPMLDHIRSVADTLGELDMEAARAELETVDRDLQEHLLPHEAKDEADVYRDLAKLLGGTDPMGAMSHTHREIVHLARLHHRLVAELPADAGAWEELSRRDLRRVLYALDAVLRLHFAQEEELYETMAEEAA